MKLETRREKQQRLKRQKRSAMIAFILSVLVVAILAVVLWRGKCSLEKKDAEYEAQITQLQSQVSEQQQRSEDLDEYEKYTHTKKYIEELAESKFGLIYPDEILFKPTTGQ